MPTNNPQKPCIGFQRGFTLVELIMTMVIIGIISAVAIPRFFDTNVFQSRGSADQVKAALRYGQKVAIAQRRTVSVEISQDSDPDCSTTLVSGKVNCKVSNRITPVTTGTYTFNGLGQPAASAVLSVGTASVTIEAETGYVH